MNTDVRLSSPPPIGVQGSWSVTIAKCDLELVTAIPPLVASVGDLTQTSVVAAVKFKNALCNTIHCGAISYTLEGNDRVFLKFSTDPVTSAKTISLQPTLTSQEQTA